ncbi:MAG: glycerol-3-phosphate 1-O-acyltransferase PlsY [Sporomusaceae bacterium]|jgi:glycerol-3-phosphate acyltransferase PlsY|nr:glycerol-3-phosphate 1-O-acyltransferase PlsY [Sporomusaceae bacterium]
MLFNYLFLSIVSYLVGAVPVGLLIGKMFGVDLRQHGSKNIGATNAYRTLGVRTAFWIFLGDALKGAFGVFFGYYLGGEYAPLVGGLFAIVGHNWPVYLGFKGGRGVATSLGVIAVIAPFATVIVFAVWFVIVFLTRYVSLASITAAALTPVLTWVLGESGEIILFTLLAALFIIIRHRPNIERLLDGTESKIKAGMLENLKKK